jgi:hypothetical protein
MKQTATEFLFDKLWETPKDKLTWNAILEQAKEMEKQQIIDAYVEGSISLTSKYESKQYYKETYDK